jgi:hypothetical protein
MNALVSNSHAQLTHFPFASAAKLVHFESCQAKDQIDCSLGGRRPKIGSDSGPCVSSAIVCRVTLLKASNGMQEFWTAAVAQV